MFTAVARMLSVGNSLFLRPRLSSVVSVSERRTRIALCLPLLLTALTDLCFVSVMFDSPMLSLVGWDVKGFLTNNYGLFSISVLTE